MIQRRLKPTTVRGWLTVILIVAGVALGATYRWWLPHVRPQVEALMSRWRGTATSSGEGEDEHAGHAHAEGPPSVTLSENSLANIAFEPLTLAKGEYWQSQSMPAQVIERPGRSLVQVSATLTSRVAKIHVLEGAAVEPGTPLFELLLVDEELVTLQRDLLRAVENLGVVQREIARLQQIQDGVVSGKRVLEQQYEQQKLEASIKADRQALLLKGLDAAQVENIVSSRQLFQSLVVSAPEFHSGESSTTVTSHLFHVQSLPVQLGQQVDAGTVLCVLADHCELYVEGKAFEEDAGRLRKAAMENWSIAARLASSSPNEPAAGDLDLLYVSDRVDPESRTYHFYLRLVNEVALDRHGQDGTRFIEWRFKPGQRMELTIPVERWENRFVVPIDAIVEEGPERYVYRQNGKDFEQVSVQVEYRDQLSAVLADNGSVFPGDVIAAHGAYQIHLALKNKSGGAIDPHAGHNH